jgi:hypothetical protein
LMRNNLDTCFVFSALAKHKIETGMRRSAERAFGYAECSYEAILRFVNSVGNGQQRSEVERKLIQLREELESLRRDLNTPQAAA